VKVCCEGQGLISWYLFASSPKALLTLPMGQLVCDESPKNSRAEEKPS
jgi:hypothetical protein